MYIPVGYAHVVHEFTGLAAPLGAAVTYGVAPNGGSFDPTDAQLLHGFFGTHIMPQLDGGLTLSNTIMKYGPNDTGPQVLASGNVNGGVTGEASVPHTAYLIRKQTALGGRANRGRIYLPGTSEASIGESGGLITAKVTSLQTAANAWLAAITGEGMNMVILHTAETIPTVVTALSVDATAATQRRRLRR